MSSTTYELNTIFGAIGTRTFDIASLSMWLWGDASDIYGFFPLFVMLLAMGRLIEVPII